MTKKIITLIPGDGIGSEVINATCKVIDASGANIAWETVVAGAKAFKAGVSSGVPLETLESLRRNKVALKGPLETPVGYGGKSVNVTLRKLFETFGNVRPVREISGIQTAFSGREIDFVVIRENVEDLYAGLEYMETPDVAKALKLITRTGSEKIIRLAFEFARAEGRSSVHCATKANILKHTEGMMKRIFEEVSKDYPDIKAYHMIVDNCAHQMVIHPEQFEVVVTTNMNGDILSDLASGLVGGLGVAPSANIGHNVSIFEAVHGSAPEIAGRNIANPLACLQSGVMMLRHLGEMEAANRIEAAISVTLIKGKRTGDLADDPSLSLGTMEFAEAIIENLGKEPSEFIQRPYQKLNLENVFSTPSNSRDFKPMGVDIFLESSLPIDDLAAFAEAAVEGSAYKLHLIASRGVMVYPNPIGVYPDMGNFWQCRFYLKGEAFSDDLLSELLAALKRQCKWSHIEKLFEVDGELAFSKSQGE